MAENPQILATAHVTVGVPEEFNFNKPEAWPLWVKRFERYMSLSNLTSKPDNEKIDLLCYCMGIKAEEILQEVLPEMNESTTFATVKEKYNSYFKRCKFDSRPQPAESVNVSETAGQEKTALSKEMALLRMADQLLQKVNTRSRERDLKLEFILDYNKSSPTLGASWSTSDYYSDCSMPYPLVDYADSASTLDEFIEKYPKVVIETSSKVYSPDTFGQEGTGSLGTIEFETVHFSNHEFSRKNIVHLYRSACMWSVNVEMGVGFKTVNSKLYLECFIDGWIYSGGHRFRQLELGFRVTKINFISKYRLKHSTS